MPVKFRIITFALFWALSATFAFANDQIRIVGSGTLYPFVTMAAEQFGEDGKFKTPIVESTGTGGGFKLFCSDQKSGMPDITDASRLIITSEQQQCAKNGINPVQIKIGYDGILLASKKGMPVLNLTKKNLFMALARELPDKSGVLTPNPYQNWHEIDASLPDQPIKIYGPGTVSGTRDAFAELVMEKGCEAFPEFTRKYSDKKQRKKICQNIREDNVFVESGEDYNILIQKLVSNEQALGIFGYSFYAQNKSKIQPSTIEGVTPSRETIVSGKYSISRGLYVYVNKQHIGKVPGIMQFIQELTSEDAIGPDGYLTIKGLIPLNDADREMMRQQITVLNVSN